jgi:hypothetical protein
MTNMWRFEIYDRNGKRVTIREQQTYEQVWLAAINCTRNETLNFTAPIGAVASEIDALLQLVAVRVC